MLVKVKFSQEWQQRLGFQIRLRAEVAIGDLAVQEEIVPIAQAMAQLERMGWGLLRGIGQPARNWSFETWIGVIDFRGVVEVPIAFEPGDYVINDAGLCFVNEHGQVFDLPEGAAPRWLMAYVENTK